MCHRDLYLEQEKLATFTRADTTAVCSFTTIVALLPPSVPPGRGLQHADAQEVHGGGRLGR